MKYLKFISSSALALVLAVTFSAGAVVSAQHGADDQSENTSTNINQKQQQSGSSGRSAEAHSNTTVSIQSRGNHTEVENETETHTESASDDNPHTGLRAEGALLLTELRKQHHTTRKTEDVKKSCEAHKQGLANKFGRTVANSERIQSRIDSIFSKAQAYQQSSNLQPATYAELLAAAQTAQTKSNESIAALKAVTPTLDCNSASVATDVATFKAAAKDTRDSLKAYRNSVKAILRALIDVKTNDGSNQ